MSKRLKSKISSSPSEAAPTPTFDRSKFVSEKAWNWYNNELHKKVFIEERGIKMVEGWDFSIQQNVYDRDWEKFVEIPPPAVYELVREFYANLVDQKGGKCFVRGKWVPFGARAINAYYGTPNIPADAWSTYDDTEEVDVDLITRTICYGDVAWEMTRAGTYKQFKIGSLTEEAKVWYSFIMSRLDPGKHVSHVTLDRAKLVYAIVSKMEIDIGRLIYSSIRRTADTTGTGIWFPSLVTALCRTAGVVIGDDEHVLKPLLPIERVSKARFRTIYMGPQRKKHREQRVYYEPSPPHGPPGVAHPVSSSSGRRFSRVTIEDRLDSIQVHQDRHEEFMKYQYDWHRQMESSMERLSLMQGVPSADLPVFPTLRPDFFPPSESFEEEPVDSPVPDGAGGWSPHVQAMHASSAGQTSSWGQMHSGNMCQTTYADDDE